MTRLLLDSGVIHQHNDKA